MSFESVKILKFSQVILENSNITYINLEEFDDRVIVLISFLIEQIYQ